MYIGVTGFTERAQVKRALESFPLHAGRQLMVGVLASHKTIYGEPAGNPKRYPERGNIAGIFINDTRALNLVHYNTRDQTNLAGQLMEALVSGGPYCHGLQLNIVWPDPDEIRKFRKVAPLATLVFQANRKVMQTGSSPQGVAEVFGAHYADLFNYVLLDASGGAGVPLDTATALHYLQEFDRVRARDNQQFRLCVAGGLCAENVAERVGPLLERFPEIGIDAEGALRTDDHLDDDKVRRYLETAPVFLNWKTA